MPKNLYLIQRAAERPAHYHESVPYHPVILCDSGKVARLEAGDTTDGATVWQCLAPDIDGSGWLLIRWMGLDVDYGCLVRGCDIPGGGHTGFWHQGGPWDLFKGALWFSSSPMPPNVATAGVRLWGEIERPDWAAWTKRSIRDRERDATDPDAPVRPFGYRHRLEVKAKGETPEASLFPLEAPARG